MRQRQIRRWAASVAGIMLVLMLTACGGTPTAVPTAAATTAAASTTPPATTSAATTSGAPAATTTRAIATAATSASTVATPSMTAATPAAATPSRAAGTLVATSYPLTVQDDAGRRVVVAKRPQRIVSLAPSTTEVVFALGLGDRVVGVDSFSNYPPEATTKPKIGNYSAANLEAIIAAAPDLIVAAGITRPDVVAALESRQLAVLILNPNDLPGIFNNLSLVGQVADVSAAAGKLRGDLEGRVATLNAKLQTATTKPRVFFELDPEQYFTVGPKSFIDDLITRAGGVNIAAGAASAYPKLSAEQIIAANPEVILLSDEAAGATPAAVQARPGWAGISAVQQQRVLVVDADKTNRPGPRAVEALEELARAIHPELFR